jgi:hypothetical protein
VEIRSFVRRLVGAIRAHWPKVEILLRADSHYAAPEGSTGVGRSGSIGFSAWPPMWLSAAMSRRWRRARPNASRSLPRRRLGWRRTAARCAFHAVLRCRRELEPGGAHHRAG